VRITGTNGLDAASRKDLDFVFVVRHEPITKKRDEPEEQDATDELGIEMLLTPSVPCCCSEAADMPVSNPNRFPNHQPQLKKLESEKSDSDGSQTRSDQSNVALV
jgi:hypothetical protein